MKLSTMLLKKNIYLLKKLFLDNTSPKIVVICNAVSAFITSYKTQEGGEGWVFLE